MTPYAKISRALLRRKDLVPAAKLILTVLDDLPPQKDHRKRASLHYLASETGQSRNTVKRVLAALSKASMVVVESQPGRRHGFLVTVVDDDGENRAQNGPGPPGPKWAPRSRELS